MPETTSQQTATPAPQPQGSHFWLMTLEIPGRFAFTSHGAYTPRPGESRQDAYEEIRAYIASQNPELERANVSFFAFDRNEV
jgi:hypothetical protein